MNLSVPDRILVGRKAIARRFGCSVRTLDRMIERKLIRTFQTGSRNSPIRARASEVAEAIERLEGRG